MKLLVLNCGSSSVKFQFIDMDGEVVLARGLVEKIGSTGANLRYIRGTNQDIQEVAEVPNHDAAINLVLSTLMHPRDGVIQSTDEINGIGHRVVHGGEEFASSCLVTDDVKKTIEYCCQFAPLHNPHHIKGINVCERLIPGKLQVVVFDTAFHHKMPPENYLYAIPFGLYKKLGIRRYGFHGTSHQYIADLAATELKRPLEELRLVTCHLGNGASVAAIKDGISIDTSMGFTPLEGLMMGTRSGDMDPAIISFLMEKEHLSSGDIDTLLNKRSGLLGITEGSPDLREVIAGMDEGLEGHRLAYLMFCNRVKKYIGAYAALLGGLDAVIFAGGIGENSARVRETVLTGLDFMGITLDPAANEESKTNISQGSTPAFVIPTNEELVIARDTNGIIEAALAQDDGDDSEATVDIQLSTLNPADRRELVLLWATDPTMNMIQLQDRFAHKVQKKLSTRALTRELERLGLIAPNNEEVSHA